MRFQINTTRAGKKYFITFIDDNTRYCHVYLLRSKDKILDVFKVYKNKVKNQLSKKIKAIRGDRGGEYDAPFDEFCKEHGIIHQPLLHILHNKMVLLKGRIEH